jgi:hypothetical protein
MKRPRGERQPVELLSRCAHQGGMPMPPTSVTRAPSPEQITTGSGW